MKPTAGLGMLALLVLAGCQPVKTSPSAGGEVDQARIEAADSRPGDWLTHGRTYSEQRFSPLGRINTGNVGKLGLAWSYDTSEFRAGEATPIVADGVMYVTSAWSKVYALDAGTGRELWVFDPEVDRTKGAYACCDVPNRGVALWKGKVYVGTIDGRLIAVDARTGAKVWERFTTDQAKPYTITGAPRVAKGLVFIGNGGAEFGVRGYVSAYDAETGAMKWRFYTVPGDPAKGPDRAASDPQMAMAAKTWNGRFWRLGGGGTVWDAIVYDQELDQLYIGVGNGSPWNQKVRSPGGGDNLFLSSIVALDPQTGRYLWHFQETPGETWDYTATQPIMLATLKIGGADRQVLLHAPKNGFFYVLDRKTGKFISGKNIVPMAKAADTPKGMPISWAYGLDANGRPLENPQARYETGLAKVTPSSLGAHNWHPWSFSPQTGLVYIPVSHTFGDYETNKAFVVREGFFNLGVKRPPYAGVAIDTPGQAAFAHGELLAWDPVAQKPAWSVRVPAAKNGGTLATAGGLVFWGELSGRFSAFDAGDGRKLWSAEAGQAVVSGPISYAIDGEQYVAVMSAAALSMSAAKQPGVMSTSRVLVFKLGGVATASAYPASLPIPTPPKINASSRVVAAGAALYGQRCVFCHGREAVSSGIVPDLRYSPVIHDAQAFRDVIAGARASQGMPDFHNLLSPADADALRAYIATFAKKAYDAEHGAR